MEILEDLVRSDDEYGSDESMEYYGDRHGRRQLIDDGRYDGGREGRSDGEEGENLDMLEYMKILNASKKRKKIYDTVVEPTNEISVSRFLKKRISSNAKKYLYSEVAEAHGAKTYDNPNKVSLDTPKGKVYTYLDIPLKACLTASVNNYAETKHEKDEYLPKSVRALFSTLKKKTSVETKIDLPTPMAFKRLLFNLGILERSLLASLNILDKNIALSNAVIEQNQPMDENFINALKNDSENISALNLQTIEDCVHILKGHDNQPNMHKKTCKKLYDIRKQINIFDKPESNFLSDAVSEYEERDQRIYDYVGRAQTYYSSKSILNSDLKFQRRGLKRRPFAERNLSDKKKQFNNQNFGGNRRYNGNRRRGRGRGRGNRGGQNSGGRRGGGRRNYNNHGRGRGGNPYNHQNNTHNTQKRDGGAGGRRRY